ncbi:MAG: nucleotide pyrophosphohydrolase [Candidatus Zhuqueibacterota bacterium]
MRQDLNAILDKIKRFRDDRDWMQFHSPKNLAVSVVLEASELLEQFQWKTDEEVERYLKANQVAVEEEVADVAIYLLELADKLGIDLIDVMERKIEKNEIKYPVARARGKAAKYTTFQ